MLLLHLYFRQLDWLAFAHWLIDFDHLKDVTGCQQHLLVGVSRVGRAQAEVGRRFRAWQRPSLILEPHGISIVTVGNLAELDPHIREVDLRRHRLLRPLLLQIKRVQVLRFVALLFLRHVAMIFLFNDRSISAKLDPAVKGLIDGSLLGWLIAGALLACLRQVLLNLRLEQGRKSQVFLYVHSDSKSWSLAFALGTIHKHPRASPWTLSLSWTVLSGLYWRL